MPFPTRRPVGRTRALCLSLLAALVPLLLGAPLIYWQVASLLAERTTQSVQGARDELDHVLDDAANAARQVMGLAGQPCSIVEQQLRTQVIASPFARSVNLVRDGVIYCTSLQGSYTFAEEAERYADGRLRLMPGNLVTPDRALIIYRQPAEDGAVLVGVDGQHLLHLLQFNGREIPLHLEVGGDWIDNDGQVSEASAPAASDNLITADSPRYPFRIVASYPNAAIGAYMREHYLPQLVLFAVLGLLAGVLTYRFGIRSTSPSRELRRALQAGEFVPYYQPLVEAGTGRWSGVEVLMRWQHPSDGLVPPDRFIPLAESLGLIVPMTQSLMDQVRDDLAAHAALLPERFHVGINITAEHCQDLHLLEQCRAFLAPFAAGNIVLVLELTERQTITSSPVTRELFPALRQSGVRIAIDDFGTGHSSLAYLREFSVDYLKIDRSFVSMIGSDAISRHLLDNILDLATRLQLDLVAEGVETTEQRDYLVQRGVHHLQGYLFARPMQAGELFAVLRRTSG